VAKLIQPDTVSVELTRAELELIHKGIRAHREYRSTSADDTDALVLLTDLGGDE